MSETNDELIGRLEDLQSRLDAAEEALRAIQNGEVDALVINSLDGDHIYTLEGADHTYRMMVEQIQEGVATMLPDGILVYANRRLASMLDEALENILGAQLLTFIPSFDHKTFKALLDQGAQASSKGKVTLRRRDGSTLPVLLTMNSVDSRGEKVISLVATDLTEQNRQEKILASERLANSILEQAAEIIVVCDLNGAIIRASQAAHDFLSANPLFQPFEKAFPLRCLDADGQEILFSIRPTLKGRSFQGLETSIALPLPDGPSSFEDCYLLLSATPLRDEDDDILGCIVTLTDITARKHAEQALLDSENRLRKLEEGNIIGIIRRDLTGLIYGANRTFLRLVGYSWDDLEAGRLMIPDMTPPPFLSTDQKALAEALTAGFCKPYEKELIHKDGRIVPVMVGYTRIDDTKDDFVGFVLDLTQLKKAQNELVTYSERLKRSNQDLEQFAFVASHDMQEPLRKIIRFGDSVADRLKPGMKETAMKETVDYVRRMQNAADRLQAMIDGLLELSRISTRGRMLEEVDLGQVAEDVISDLDVRIHQTKAKIQLGPLPVIEADPIQMRQLFQNLIANALKFHKPDTKPFISIKGEVDHDKDCPGGYTILEVADNGIGFDEKDAAWIFQPFRRLHENQDYSGSGMGLAICAKIVQRHHGTITVHSQPGEGSVFTIQLPLRHEDVV